MYHYIVAAVGKRWANAVATLVYTAMTLAILYCIFEPQADFRYLAL